MTALMHKDDVQFHEELDASRGNDQKVETFYEKWAKKYDDILSYSLLDINDYSGELLAKYLPNKDAVILDVGCGTGFTAVAAAKYGFKTIDGTDFSEGMLKEAKNKGVYRNLFKGMISDNVNLDCKPNTYDGIVCVSSITPGHIKPQYAMKEFVRVSKPNSIFVYTIHPKLDICEVMDAHKELFANKSMELVLMERKFYFRVKGETTYCIIAVMRKL